MIFNGSTKVKKLYIGSTKVKKVYKGTTKVWNSGYPISYYYGNTLLGVEEVEENADATHPNIVMPTKSGYTFIGWATSNSENDWVSEYLVTAPANLYAIYIPNTLTVVSNGSNLNPKYVSGTFSAWTDPHWTTGEAGGSFTLAKGKYGTATCTMYAMFYDNNTGNLDVGDATFDGDAIIGTWITGGSEGSKSYTIGNGSHSLFVRAVAYDDYSQGALVRVSSLVLSNPVAWT